MKGFKESLGSCLWDCLWGGGGWGLGCGAYALEGFWVQGLWSGGSGGVGCVGEKVWGLMGMGSWVYQESLRSRVSGLSCRGLRPINITPATS